MNNQVFEEPRATLLDQMRENRRAKGRLTYDCNNARVNPDGTVGCRLGRKLSLQRVSLVRVLRGCHLACAKCEDYDDGGEIEGGGEG